MSRRRGYVTVSVDTDIDVDVEYVLDQVSDADLSAEMRSRSMKVPDLKIADTLREWRDALERGDNPMRVAASIRAFMFNELPPVTIELPERARRLSS